MSVIAANWTIRRRCGFRSGAVRSQSPRVSPWHLQMCRSPPVAWRRRSQRARCAEAGQKKVARRLCRNCAVGEMSVGSSLLQTRFSRILAAPQRRVTLSPLLLIAARRSDDLEDRGPESQLQFSGNSKARFFNLLAGGRVAFPQIVKRFGKRMKMAVGRGIGRGF